MISLIGATINPQYSGVTGLTSGGALGVTVYDDNWSAVVARITTGIVELPTASGYYKVTSGYLTAPTTPGYYSLVWDHAGAFLLLDELWVTGSQIVVPATPGDYITGSGSPVNRYDATASNTWYIDTDSGNRYFKPTPGTTGWILVNA